MRILQQWRSVYTITASCRNVRLLWNYDRLPILFAYKTFSCTEEHEKFRATFALSDVTIDSFTSEVVTSMFMKIFTECDEACKDSSCMFFGGKGLLRLADEPIEISGHGLSKRENR